MPVIKNDAGRIRLFWRILLAVLLYVAAAVLLRLIPIVVYAALLRNGGMAQGSALEQARNAVFDDPAWFAAIGVLSGLIGLLIVWFLIAVVEKSRFTWKILGLDWRSSSLAAVLSGAVLALLLFLAGLLAGKLLGYGDASLADALKSAGVSVFCLNLAVYLAMAFGEEVIFRGYIQAGLAARYGAVWGIPVGAALFVVLHQISYDLSPVLILSGILLWTTVGALYHMSRSLYLVIVFHGVMNTLQNTLHAEIGDLRSLAVHAVALLLVVLAAVLRPRIATARADPV